MICSNCGFENPDDRKFCGECGTSLSVICPNCGTPNGPRFKFCGECGHALPGRTTPASAGSSAEAPRALSERRLVSVLFADLVGFTTLSDSRDPDEVRELLSNYFDTASRLIDRYGGAIEKFIGDAVMAVWGTPVAQEDDAERAVRAALDLVEAVREMGVEAGADLHLRCGVLTGEAAVTVGATNEGMVAGDLVNTASRVQGVAEPGTVLVNDVTRRATEAAVAYEDAGSHQLKGKAEPVRVIGGRGGALRSTGLEAPFVGRERELRLTKELFHAVADSGTAHLLTVIGIAGIGKSRLSWEFFKYIDGLAPLVYWHRGRCLSYGEGVTYWALAEMVRSRAGITEGEDPASAADKLQQVLVEHLSDPEEREWVHPRLAHLLGLEERTAREPEDLFSAWRLFFERLADKEPTVLVFEDMQWADRSLLDFVEYLMTWSRNHQLFVMALARPELTDRHPGWAAGQRASTTLHLEPLSDSDMDRLLQGFVPGLPETMRRQILDRAEGVPLYAVETVRMLLDRGLLTRDGATYRVSGEVGDLAVPETLHALIAARLDGLDPKERALIQDAAVLGKTFPVAALAAVTGLPESEVQMHLTSLTRKEILGIQADPRSPNRGQYGFLQDLVRRVAYETLSRRDRKARHLTVAEHLRTSGREDDAEVEVIASHYLDAYRAVPDAPDAPDIKAKAREALVQAARRSESLAAAPQAARYYEQAIELTDDPSTLADLYERVGLTGISAGVDVEKAREWLEESIRLYEGEGRRHDAARVVSRLAEVAFGTGRLEEALSRVEDAHRVLAEEGPSKTLAAVAGQAGRLLVFIGRGELALERVEESLQLAETLGLPDVFAHTLNTKGVILFTRGRREEGVLLIRHALKVALDNELIPAALRAYNNLGSTLGGIDAFDESLSIARDAVELARRFGDLGWGHKMLVGQVGPLVAVGRWDEAMAIVEEFETAVQDVEAVHQGVAIEALPQIEIFVDRGQVGEAEEALRRYSAFGASDEIQTRSVYAYDAACVLRALGREDEAYEQAERAAGGREELGLDFNTVRAGLGLQAEILLSRGRVEEAAGIVGELEAATTTSAPRSRQGLAARLRGLVDAAAGDDDSADTSFASAAGHFRAVGMRFEVARVQTEHAEWLISRERREDAEPLIEEAREVFAELRATPWLERLERLTGTPPATVTRAAEL